MVRQWNEGVENDSKDGRIERGCDGRMEGTVRDTEMLEEETEMEIRRKRWKERRNGEKEGMKEGRGGIREKST